MCCFSVTCGLSESLRLRWQKRSLVSITWNLISFDLQRTPNVVRSQDNLYGTVDQLNGSWDVYLASPADFAGVVDIITNLAKERAWDRDHRTHSIIFDYYLL